MALLLGSRLNINGSPHSASIIQPIVPLSNYAAEIEVDLPTGAAVSLQMFAPLIVGAAMLPSGACGASLMIIRLS